MSYSSLFVFRLDIKLPAALLLMFSVCFGNIELSSSEKINDLVAGMH